jgi:hypothetical protein
VNCGGTPEHLVQLFDSVTDGKTVVRQMLGLCTCELPAHSDLTTVQFFDHTICRGLHHCTVECWDGYGRTVSSALGHLAVVLSVVGLGRVVTSPRLSPIRVFRVSNSAAATHAAAHLLRYLALTAVAVRA